MFIDKESNYDISKKEFELLSETSEDEIRTSLNLTYNSSYHFLLSLKDALIYDLDETPVITKKWTELENIKIYYNFFKEYEKDFNE